ncbi:hypothetical protein ACRRTK_022178 [Alexandromys fortis]
MLSILLLCACLLQACLLQALLQRVPALPPCVQTCLLCAQLLLLCLLLPAQLLQALLQHVPALPSCVLPPSLLWPLLGPEVQLLMGPFPGDPSPLPLVPGLPQMEKPHSPGAVSLEAKPGVLRSIAKVRERGSQQLQQLRCSVCCPD